MTIQSECTHFWDTLYIIQIKKMRKKINTSPVFVQNVDKAGGTVKYFLICMEIGLYVLC
jgi:hypothetical protein